MQSTTHSPGLRLYDYAASANCYKVRLLLAQLGRAYERIPVDIFAGETLGDGYAAINPAREVPVLETEDGRLLPDRAPSSSTWRIRRRSCRPMPSTAPRSSAGSSTSRRWSSRRWAVCASGSRPAACPRTTRARSPGAGAPRPPCACSTAIWQAASSSPVRRYSVADIALYAYIHVAGEAGIELPPYANVSAWLERVRLQPGHMNDLAPYPPNSRAGAGRSIYD